METAIEGLAANSEALFSSTYVKEENKQQDACKRRC